MASYEAGGRIVLSYEPRGKKKDEVDERETFEKANLETIRELLKHISPLDYSRGSFLSSLGILSGQFKSKRDF